MPGVELLLPLVAILVGARLAGRLSQRLGMPAVLGELLAGLVLGPSVLGWVHLNETFTNLAGIGVLLLMFIAGLETDMSQLQQVGKSSFVTAIGGVVLPFAGGLGVALAAGLGWMPSLFLATTLTATSVSVSVQTLHELGRLRSKEGMIILGAAIIDDVLGILLLSLVLGFAGQGGNPWLSLLRLVLFFPIALFVGNLVLRPLLHWIKVHHAREAGFALIIALVLLFAWAAEALGGLAAITGAYLAGVLLARIPDARDGIVESAAVVGYGIFVPVFFVAVGLQTDVRNIALAPVLTLVVIAVAVVSKALGSGLGARITGCTNREAAAVGSGMIARGEVALVMASLGLSAGLLDTATFTVVVVMTLATTLLTPLLLKLTAPAPQPAGAPAAPISPYTPVPIEVEPN
jgi:Kef-type K+ transport system membrane component KefB